jgi:hypothetical protein
MPTVNPKPRRNLRIAKIASPTKEPARAMPAGPSSVSLVIGGENAKVVADR